MFKYIAFVLFIFISINLKAQTWEIGGAAGGSGYMGDLNPNNPLKVSGIAISGFIKRNFDGYLSAKLNYTYGSISAADSNSNDQQFRARNLSFSTSLFEISVLGEFNFLKYIPEAGKNKFTPYIFVGVGSLSYYPAITYQGQKYDARAYVTEGEKKGYPTTAISIPYGAGVKYNILGKWTIMVDIGYRNPNTDYLDDVSGVYPVKHPGLTLTNAFSDRSGEKTGNYIGAAGTQRGDLNPRDTYFFLQLGLSYTFVTKRCYFQ